MQLEIISHEPTSTRRRTPLLFVHGMWHGAWCWEEHFLPYFAQHGYSAHALSLRGHSGSEGGERLRWHSLSNYVSDVKQAVEGMERPPVLIGHSMGGVITQKYLETHQAPAAVLLGSIPPGGLIPATLRFARRHPLAFLKVILTMRMYPVVSTPEMYREGCFTDDFPEEQLMSYFEQVHNESFRAYVDLMIFNLPRPKRVKTPLLVLGAANDMLITPQEVRATARAYGTAAEFFPNMGHNMMLETGWQAVADWILEWLGKKAL